MNKDDQITYFGETDSRNRRVKFGIKASDRTKHVYVIGKTGMGKSTLLENMAIQDIQNGNGLAFIDPHGKTAQLLLEYIPEHRIKDVLYLAPFDMEFPVSFNVMEDVGADRRHLVVNGLMSAFKRIWVDAWSGRMEYILGNTLLALLEYPGATLLGVNRMLSEKDFRNKVVANITDPSIKSFWVDEFAKYNEKYMQEAGDAIKNKIGQFTNNPLIRNIIGQPKSTFDLRDMMDKNKIIIINLSKGLVGEANANLLGSMIITKIYLAAMSRADASPALLNKLPNFYLYVDEFQSFANESFADILSEARKYKLNLTIAHQYIEQMLDEVRAAVFGNVGTMISFRVGSYDAEVLEKEFAPYFMAQDIVNLDKYQLYLKLMIDGVASQPFSANGMGPIEKPIVSFTNEIVASSRKNFAKTRAEVEEAIKAFHEEKHSVKPTPKVVTKPVVAAPTVVPMTAVSVEPLEAKPEVVPQPLVQKAPVTPAVGAAAPSVRSSTPSVPRKSFDRKPAMKVTSQSTQEPIHRPILSPTDLEKAIASGDLVPVEDSPVIDQKTKKTVSAPANNQLKSALAALLAEQQKKTEAPKNEIRPPRAPSTTTHTAPSVKSRPAPYQAPKAPEVPEDILRNILNS